MDNEEAKFVLRAYRSSGADAGDPLFATALQQARQDPTLGQWFEAEQALDRLVSERLKKLNPPAGLREAILAGGKVSIAPRGWWRQGQWLALAASLAILLGATYTWTISRRHATIDRMETLAIQDVLRGGHDNEGSANAHLRAVLENASVHLSSGNLPASLADLTTTGCRTLNFNGHEIAEICFLRDGHDYHLYVMSRMNEMPSTPRMIQHADGSAAAWADERNSYVVASRGSVKDLARLL